MKSIMYAMRLYYFSGRNIRKLDNAYECWESYTGFSTKWTPGNIYFDFRCGPLPF